MSQQEVNAAEIARIEPDLPKREFFFIAAYFDLTQEGAFGPSHVLEIISRFITKVLTPQHVIAIDWRIAPIDQESRALIAKRMIQEHTPFLHALIGRAR
jgi:hypothetical protein